MSRATLQSHLDAEVITDKTILNHNQARNPENSLASCAEWVEWFLANLHSPFVSVDEFGFNRATQRNSERSRREQPAIQVTAANRGGHASVGAAIQRAVGIVCHRVSETVLNRRSFNPVSNLCIILDNCRIHQDLDLGDKSASRLMFNLIEEVFADLKRSIPTSFSTTMHAEVLGIQTLPWGEKAGARRQLLSRVLHLAFQGSNGDQADNH
jgi:hypothetical protein